MVAGYAWVVNTPINQYNIRLWTTTRLRSPSKRVRIRAKRTNILIKRPREGSENVFMPIHWQKWMQWFHWRLFRVRALGLVSSSHSTVFDCWLVVPTMEYNVEVPKRSSIPAHCLRSWGVGTKLTISYYRSTCTNKLFLHCSLSISKSCTLYVYTLYMYLQIKASRLGSCQPEWVSDFFFFKRPSNNFSVVQMSPSAL